MEVCYNDFLMYVRDNYSEYAGDLMLDHYIQSGDFPEDFIDYVKEFNDEN